MGLALPHPQWSLAKSASSHSIFQSKHTGKVAKNQVAQCHRPGVGIESVLPVLVDIQTIKATKRSKVGKSNIGHVSRSTGVSFDKCNLISLDNADVPGFLIGNLALSNACEFEEYVIAYDVRNFRRNVEASN